MQRREKTYTTMNIPMPLDVHAQLQIAAAMDGRSMRRFIIEAVRERAQLFLNERMDSPTFVPPGLR